MSQRILVVEDSRTVRRVLERTLSQAGFVVDVARDGQEGLERTAEQKPDLILLDFVMPNLNGLQFCQAIAQQEANADIPIVLISARADKIGKGFAEQTGAVGVLQKPFSPEALLATVTHGFARAQERVQRAMAATSPGTMVAPHVGERISVSGLLAPQSLEAAEHEKEAVAERLLLRMVDALLPHAAKAGISWDRAAFVAALVSKHDPEEMFALVSELSMIARAAPSAVALEGNLEHVGLGDVLQMLAQERQTGTVEIFDVSGGTTRTVWLGLSEGALDLAVGNLGAEFMLSRYLLQGAFVDEVTLQRALEECQTSRSLLGTQLVREGHLSADQLQAALGAQTSDLLYEVLRWRKGHYRFLRLMTRGEANAARLGLSLEMLLMEGLRRVDEWRVLDDVLGGPTVLYRGDKEASRLVDQHRLNTLERAVLAAADGTRTLGALALHLRKDTFDVAKALQNLVQSRLVRSLNELG